MARRDPGTRFMGGAWVFPGGAVDPGDEPGPLLAASDDEAAPWLAAGLRELVEETGIWITTHGAQVTDPVPADAVYDEARCRGLVLDGEALVFFAHWVTPEPLPIRFDTRFYLTAVPRDIEPRLDGRELVDAVWVTPGDALARFDAGEWVLAFPTVRILDSLAGFRSVEEVVSWAATLRPRPVQPRVAPDGEGGFRLLLPGDPGFEEAGRWQGDPRLRARLRDVGRGSLASPGQR